MIMQLYIAFAHPFRINLYLAFAKSTISIWFKRFGRNSSDLEGEETWNV